MAQNLTQKIIAGHLVSGEMTPGQEVGLRIDQTLTQDATGTMADLQFEAMGILQVRTKLSLSYVDHNMLQVGFENADDHRFLQSIAAKYGLHFSRPGNGICHQVHLERFAVPGQTLLGADSHTVMAGALAMLAIGAGGLDVAVAMGGGPYYVPMPKVVGVRLTGSLGPWVAGKDVIFEVLRRLTSYGGTGKIMEYHGPGAVSLTVPQRAVICNMGAELGATASVFPADEQALAYLRAQGREKGFQPLAADPEASYDELVEIDLSALEPLIARPSNPDNVTTVREVEGTPVAQVCVGSCQNSSYSDLAMVAAILRGKTVHPNVSLIITPGSRQVMQTIAQTGVLADLINAGARIMECACGPCIGMGQAPPTGGVSVRSMNRNFPGRSGTPNDQVYLASPEVCAATALAGVITDPRRLGVPPHIDLPVSYVIDDSMVLPPSPEPEKVEVIRGPNIKPLPLASPPAEQPRGQVLLKLGDNISTDHILPAGARVLPLRSNIPAIAEFTFAAVDPSFVRRAQQAEGGFIVGGSNYGQGSSREHAAIAPMYLGVKAVLTKSFARIHWANLVNFGIVPLTFVRAEDYDQISQGDELEILDLRAALSRGHVVRVRDLSRRIEFEMQHNLSPRQVEVLLAGGLLNHIRGQAGA